MNWLNQIILSMLPNYCSLCEKKLTLYDRNCFCCSCWEKIEFSGEHYCKKCGKNVITAQGLCHECEHKKYFHHELRALGVYDHVLKQAIHHYKFSFRWRLAHDFSDLILKKVESQYLEENDFLVPVPLSRARLLERGFHQTFLITKILSRKLGIPVLKDLLLKTRDTPPQSLLNKEERMENLKGSLKVNRKDLPLVRGKKVLLFDDVYTTGSTVQECCQALRESRIERIRVLVLGRAH